jgi:pyruvate-formate lyase
MDLRYQQRFDAQQKALEAALLSQEKAVQTAMTASEKATTKSELAAEKRFDSNNEFREQLRDQAATLMPRSEAENRAAALSEKIDDLKATIVLIQGRSTGRNDIWGYLVGGAGLIAAIIVIVAKF